MLSDKPLLEPSQRLAAMRAFFALANGPLAGALLMNKNALVFHDIERTSAVAALTERAIAERSSALAGT